MDRKELEESICFLKGQEERARNVRQGLEEQLRAKYGNISEYYRLRMVVSVEKCLTASGEPDPGDEFETKSEVERQGIAMSWHEAEESLAGFMAGSAIGTLMEVCGMDDCEAGARICEEANDRIPEGC